MGLPVASCKIPVLMRYFSDEISFCETPEEFVTEAKRLTAEDNPLRRTKRRNSVKDWSWESRYEYVRNVLEI